MGTALRHTKLSLKEQLENEAHKFSFEMASYILEYGSEFSFGKEFSIFQASFRTISINSLCLRATEIEKLVKINGTNVIFVERLAISGLNAPLPTPYTELIMKRSAEKDLAMQSFINMFNSRLLGISYQISKRRYLCLQKHSEKNCMLVKSIATFLGEDNPATMNRHLSRLSYLFWTKERSAAGLEAIITSVFQLETKIRQFPTVWLNLSQKNILGKNCYRLGKSAELGTRASVSTLGVEIHLTHKNFEILSKFLSNNQYFQKMMFFVRKYLGDFVSCYLKITPHSVPPLVLGMRGNGVLGRTAWFQSKGKIDAATIVENISVMK